MSGDMGKSFQRWLEKKHFDTKIYLDQYFNFVFEYIINTTVKSHNYIKPSKTQNLMEQLLNDFISGIFHIILHFFSFFYLFSQKIFVTCQNFF